MNKKLKLYCSLFVAVFIVYLFFNFFNVSLPFSYASYGEEKLAFMDAPAQFYDVYDSVSTENGSSFRSSVKTVNLDVNVKPKHHSLSDDKGLFSISSDQIYQIQMESVKIKSPSRQTSTLLIVIAGVSALISLIVVIWIIALILKIVSRIRKGEIFASQVARFLDIAGKLLVGLYLFRYFFAFIYNVYCIRHIHLAEYYVVYKNDTNIMLILTGLGLMIIAQIILMGKDLKEEQDLTI